jgi:hypothetical protein
LISCFPCKKTSFNFCCLTLKWFFFFLISPAFSYLLEFDFQIVLLQGLLNISMWQRTLGPVPEESFKTKIAEPLLFLHLPLPSLLEFLIYGSGIELESLHFCQAPRWCCWLELTLWDPQKLFLGYTGLMAKSFGLCPVLILLIFGSL